MIHKLTETLYKELSSNLPTKIIAQGNAFSFNEISDKERIAEIMKKLEFDVLAVISTSKNEGNELEVAAEVSIFQSGFETDFQLSASLVSLDGGEVTQYLIDFRDQFIYLKFK